MSTNSTIEQLELQLRYNFDYVEADFVPLRKQSERTLFTYEEILQMELDALKHKESNAANRTNTKRT